MLSKYEILSIYGILIIIRYLRNDLIAVRILHRYQNRYPLHRLNIVVMHGPLEICKCNGTVLFQKSASVSLSRDMSMEEGRLVVGTSEY